MLVKIINWVIKLLRNKSWFKDELISDGYHSFDELYQFRLQYQAALFNVWAKLDKDLLDDGIIESAFDEVGYDVHKSWKHNDGEYCFGKPNKWFIVVAILPSGQITNHYKAKDWDLFQIPSTEKAKYKFDGHTPSDCLHRLRILNQG